MSGASRSSGATPRVVVVHDYLTQRGGAERVVLSLLRTFPGATVLTSVYDPAGTFAEFAEHDVRTTWLQRVPLARRDPRLALPLLSRAFASMRLPEADVVVCSSSGWAHGVPSSVPKIVYCHNPPRWLHQTSDYAAGQPLPARLTLEVLRTSLTGWDRRAAHSATRYLANSSTVRDRVRRTYGLEAEVVPPAFGLDPAGPQEPVPGVEPGFVLSVSRPRGYKNSALLAEAVEDLPGVRLFLVGGRPADEGTRRWSERIQGGRDLSDAQLRWLYAHCAGLVAIGHEDFGLTPLEANAFGAPVACLAAGGYLDTVRPGVTGVFVEGLTAPLVRDGVQRLLSSSFDRQAILEHAAGYSQEAFSRRLRAVVDDVLSARRGPAVAALPTQVDLRQAPVGH